MTAPWEEEGSVVEESPVEKKKAKKAPKEPKAKKRPSDFEIVRTLLTRTTERKLPRLLKNMGEDDDILLLCSEEEDGFVYGSSSMTIGMVEFEDPELKEVVNTVLEKLYGYDSPNQVMINIRDQISELAKTKGEAMGTDPEKDGFGSTWIVKTDVRGQESTLYYSKAIESLYHFQSVKSWCESFRHLLSTQDPNYLFHPYNHPDGDTYTILSIPTTEDDSHPIAKLYPHGFRTSVTRGIDLIITKMFDGFPYPVLSEEIIVFQTDGAVCQMVHRVIGEGWRMILLRPNSVLFPTLSATLPATGSHEL